MGFFDFLFGNKKREEQERLERERLAEQERQRKAEARRIAQERERRLAENRRKEEERQRRLAEEKRKEEERNRMAQARSDTNENREKDTSISIKDIAAGSPFELEFYVSVMKQVYNSQATDVNITPNCKARIVRSAIYGDVRIEFDNLPELKEKGIIQSNLTLSPKFSYNMQDPDVEMATAEINNSFAAVHSGKEYISLFQITKQNGYKVAFLINNLPNEGDYYYLIILNEKMTAIKSGSGDQPDTSKKEEKENPARPKGLKISREDMVIEYKAYERCTEYASRLQTAKDRGFLTPPYPFGDGSYTQMLCKEDCIFCHCPFYARNLLDELRHNHRTDYDEWVMDYFKTFK